jgi:hypothetical protein
MNYALPIAGILTSEKELRDEVIGLLEPHFGSADIIGEWMPFGHTNYYEDEMGPRLARSFVAFEKLVEEHFAASFKKIATDIEDALSVDGRRRVNIDPGFISSNKLVLVSGKYGGNKIALAQGVWADMLLWYNKGWTAMPWAFPDFRNGELFPLFMKMRGRLKEKMKTGINCTEILRWNLP